jgi:hypothetical protein
MSDNAEPKVPTIHYLPPDATAAQVAGAVREVQDWLGQNAGADVQMPELSTEGEGPQTPPGS